MAVYRESAPAWRRRLPLIAGALIILIVIIGAVLLTRPRSDSPTDSKVIAGQAVDTIAQSLDLFDIEYAKIVKGAPASGTGAPGAIRKALDTLATTKSTLQALDSSAADKLQLLLNDLNSALSANPLPDITNTISGANAQLQMLRAAIPH